MNNVKLKKQGRRRICQVKMPIVGQYNVNGAIGSPYTEYTLKKYLFRNKSKVQLFSSEV